jgi:hypothetical protein
MEEILLAIAEAIAEKIGAAAYDRLTASGGGDAQDNTLAQMQREIDDARIGMARSHHGNAARQVGYYRNDPVNRQASLHDAEVENGFAMSELEVIRNGLPTCRAWLCAAELQMAILQEWLIIVGGAGGLPSSGGEQQNINDHYNYMFNHYAAVRDLGFSAFDYCHSAPDPEAPGSFWYYCGLDPVHVPSDAEDQWLSDMSSCKRVLIRLKTITTPTRTLHQRPPAQNVRLFFVE